MRRSRQDSIFLGTLALAEDRKEAAPILKKLREGACHRLADLSGRERRILLRGPLMDYLLELSYSFRSEDPQRMVLTAKAACAVADTLSTRRYGTAVVADLRARAWGELANAYRVTDDYEKAGGAFAHSLERLRAGTKSAALVGRFLELLGSYLKDLRRFSEATVMLSGAKDLYKSCADMDGLERTLLTLALVLGDANEPELALDAYIHLIGDLRPDSPYLFAAVHGLVLNLVESGRPDLARPILKKFRYTSLYRRAGKLNKYRWIWLEGKIASGLNEFGRAEAKLNTARFAFQYRGQHEVAALIALDLAWIYAKTGQRAQVIWHVDHMLRTFRALGIWRESYASLILLKKSCEKRRPTDALCGQIEGLMKLLPELGRKSISSS